MKTRPKTKPPAKTKAGSPAERGLEVILEKIRATRNFDFRNYKRATLRRRIQRRMREQGIRSYADYAALLDREPEEYGRVLEQMLIKVTSFFRDAELWETLSSRVIPEIVAHKRPGEEIRVWSAGCATGEEAYSLAILIAETLGVAAASYETKVFGTDLDEAAVAWARRGIYTMAQVEGLPQETLDRWFTRVPEGWQVRKEIRRSVVFGVNNLVSDAPISRLDLLLCRNVFIYLDVTLQKRVLVRFHYALRRDGLIVLGKSELIPYASKIFQSVDLHHRIYRKEGAMPDAVGAARLLAATAGDGSSPAVEAAGRHDPYGDVFASLPIPAIATGLDGTVLAWNNAAAKLWGRSPQEVAGRKLTALNLPGMRGELLVEKTAAVRDGESNGESAEGTVDRPGDPEPIAVCIEVSPVRSGRAKVGLLYTVRDVTQSRAMSSELRLAIDERQAGVEELQTTNEELQSSNEELETTNEELQSANEELQTTNEELQSMNEELETTNEELQSANAELDATNRELAHRTEELHLLSLYQRTIIRSLADGVLVLDATGTVTIWNLAAERLLGVTETEAVGQLLWTLHIPALKRPVIARLRRSFEQRKVLREEELEYELPSGGIGSANLALVPLVDEGMLLGAVVLFEDCTRIATHQKENIRLRELLSSVKGAGRTPRASPPPASKGRAAAAPRNGKRGRRG